MSLFEPVSGLGAASSGGGDGTLPTLAANRVLAGPAVSGSAVAAGRLLVAADIPDLSSAYVTPASLSSTLSSYVTGSGLATTLAAYVLASALSAYAPLNSPTLVTPTLGVAVGTSLALNGATLGTNKLAVAGTSLLTDKLTITQATANTGILASTGYSLTGSNATSMIDLAGTWNTSGTPTAILLNVTDTASNAASKLLDCQIGGSTIIAIRKDFSILFGPSGSSHPALVRSGSGLLALTTNSGDYINITGSGFATAGTDTNALTRTFGLRLSSTNNIRWSSTTAYTGTADLYLERDAANILAQRNSTSAQTGRIYATYTDSSNGAWSFQDAAVTTAATYTIGTSGNGTGASTLSKFQFHILGTNRLDYNITNPSQWTFSPTVVFSNDLVFAGGSQLTWTSFGAIRWTAANNMRISNAAATDFGLLQFGGTSSSFPALKRSTTDLQVRLADDSGYAGLQLGTASTALKVGTHSAIAAETVTGYITIKDSAGTDRKIAVVS